MTLHPPDWVKDAVFYQIFPDRFASSPHVPKPGNLEPWDVPPTRRGFKGGDLLGVLEHLDYLVDLGVNALYLNPIFQSAANHRYHTYDYAMVDPILGGNEAFDALLAGAHQAGVRVILDGVFNHAGRGLYQFNHILENGDRSPYLDWFSVYGFPLWAFDNNRTPNYAAWWNNRELPKFNTENPQVRGFIMDVAEMWLRRGIDGWRLDVPLEIQTRGFWEEFRERVKAINPEAYLVAEIWHDAKPWLQGEHFDAVMNYGFNRACYGFFGGAWLDVSQRPGGFQIAPLDGFAFAGEIDRLLGLYGPEVTLAQYNLISSHDEPRFLTMVRGDKRRLRLATLFQMVFPGVPSVYYGDEIGMEGKSDPDCRRAFPWDERHWDRELHAEFKRFIALRQAHPALRRGRYTLLAATQAVYAFARHDDAETVIVVLNVGDAVERVELHVAPLIPEGVVHEAWAGTSISAQEGYLRFDVPPLDARVFIAE